LRRVERRDVRPGRRRAGARLPRRAGGRRSRARARHRYRPDCATAHRARRVRARDRAELTLRLSVPPEGLRAGDVVLRFPSLDDVDAILPAFTDPELREAGNLPAFGREELIASLRDLPTLAEAGRLLAL